MWRLLPLGSIVGKSAATECPYRLMRLTARHDHDVLLSEYSGVTNHNMLRRFSPGPKQFSASLGNSIRVSPHAKLEPDAAIRGMSSMGRAFVQNSPAAIRPAQ